MKTKLNKKGFTLIELVLVITVLGVLSVVAIPGFIDMSQRARDSARAGVVGSIREGIMLFRSRDLVENGPPGLFPPTLDAVSSGSQASVASPIFGTVLQHPVTTATWTKVDDTHYTYTDGTITATYTYSPATGTFNAPGQP